MPEHVLHPQYEPRGLLAAAAGLLWLAIGTDGGILSLLLCLPAGLLLTSTGIAACAYAGDPRINHTMAFGGVIGVLLGVPGLLVYGPVSAVLLVLVSAGSALLSGWLALRRQPRHPDAPGVEITPLLALKVVLDNTLLGYFVGTARIPVGERASRVAEETLTAHAHAKKAGWLRQPVRFHRGPALPDAVNIEPAHARGHDYLHVSWRSEYEPHEVLPGAARFNSYTGNQTMHGWMLRHDDPEDAEPRPWLMAIHGYRMGRDWLDFSLFPPGWLHHKLGFNVFMPLLPLHGHRRMGWRSGDGYLEGEFLDLLNAQSQALFDLRTAVLWLRQTQRAERLGVMGYSLGGYNAALLAGYVDDIEALICGIPVVDFASALWRNFPAVPRAGMETLGVTDELVAELLTPIDPLARPCRAGHRAVFGGLADQLIPQEQVLALADHLGLEQPTWFNGSHLSVRREGTVRDIVEAELLASGLLAEPVRGDLAAQAG